MASNNRISTLSEYGLVAFAVAADTVQLLIPLPFFGTIIALTAYAALWLWFTLIGVNFFEGKRAAGRMATFFGGALSELLSGVLPLLGGFLPMTTISTIMIIAQTRKADREAAAQAPPQPLR